MKKLYTLIAIVACAATASFAQTAGTPVNFAQSTKGTAVSEILVTPNVGEINNSDNVKIYSYGNVVYVNSAIGFSKSNVQVYNLLGELVLDTRMSSTNSTFTIENRASSYYIVKVTLDDKAYTKRVYIR